MYCPDCGSKAGYVVDGKVICAVGCQRERKAKPSKSPEERFESKRNNEYREHVRQMACVILRCQTGLKVQAAHVRTRATGTGDEGNIVPLCAGHHAEQHHIGIRSFEKRYRVNLKAIADLLWLKYEQDVIGRPTL